MNAKGAAGIVLLVLGACALLVGVNSSQSPLDQVSDTLTGRFTDRTMWWLAGGALSGLCGALLLFMGARGKLI